jgi:serine/threonine-protein kinase
VAAALVEAHHSGVIHCDVKPENIVLVPEEPCALRPKILDFGLARMQAECGADDDLILGTPEYMAPEQLLGADIDGRVDVWGLCVTLYELIAGVRPFTASRREGLSRAILLDAPPPLGGGGVADEALWSILDRGLAKHRPWRWSSMRELGVALATWAHGRGLQRDFSGARIARWLREGAPA